MSRNTPPPDTGAWSLRAWWARLGAWWARRRWGTRRTITAVVVVVLTGVLSLQIGLFAAKADIAIGPHEATIEVTTNHLVRLDLGPLGALELNSPAPWPVGALVVVGEIPATLSEVDNPLESLGGDVAAYAQFFSEPGASVEGIVRAVVQDVARRTVLIWSVLLVLGAAARLAADGVLAAEVRSRVRRAGVAPLAAATVVSLLVVAGEGAFSGPDPHGRPSLVLAELGPELADARVTGRFAALLDTYGELALAEVERNNDFYDELTVNLAAAYAADPEPLAPRRPLPAVVPVVPDEGPGPGGEVGSDVTPDADLGSDASSGDDAGSDASPGDDAGSDATPGSTATPSAQQDATQQDATQPESAQPQPGQQQPTRSPWIAPEPGPMPAPSPTPTPGRATPPRTKPDIVTAMVISDNHCNLGMARVFGAIADLAQVDLVLNGGDTTLGGSSVESICVDTVASALPDVPVVVADGNHDSPETGDQGRAAGWTVLDGGVVEVAGLRIIGDRDARLTSLTLGTVQYRSKTEAAASLSEAACAAVDPDDPATQVDILLIHDPYVGNRVMPSGCVVMEVSGHLHRRIGPVQQGLGTLYLNASSGGSSEGRVPLGPLRVPAFVSILQYDRANKEPVALREITLTTDAEVELGEWEPFPVSPSQSVMADLSLEAWPSPS